MKIVSWNVNGLRACITKGFVETIKKIDADVYCIQETKAKQQQVKIKIDGYSQYWNSSEGYSSVLVFAKEEPIHVNEDFGIEKFDIEGRLLTLEFADFFVLNVYMPMSKSRISRSDYRSEWDDEFLKYIETLSKPVIICGDFNVAHKYIYIYPENLRNEENPPGFEEMEKSYKSDTQTRLRKYNHII